VVARRPYFSGPWAAHRRPIRSALETALGRAADIVASRQSKRTTKNTTPGIAGCSCVRRYLSPNYPSRHQLFIGQFWLSFKMEYRGRHFTIVQGVGPDSWKWTVHLDSKTVKSGEAKTCDDQRRLADR
jgi:hypothetical protein